MRKVRNSAKTVSVVAVVAVMATVLASALAASTGGPDPQAAPTAAPSAAPAPVPSALPLRAAGEPSMLAAVPDAQGRAGGAFSCQGTAGGRVSLFPADKQGRPAAGATEVVCDGRPVQFQTSGDGLAIMRAVPSTDGLVLAFPAGFVPEGSAGG